VLHLFSRGLSLLLMVECQVRGSNGFFVPRAVLDGGNAISRCTVVACLPRCSRYSPPVHGNRVRANLIRAKLSGAKLSGADLRRANLSEAKLSGANLIRAAQWRSDPYLRQNQGVTRTSAE